MALKISLEVILIIVFFTIIWCKHQFCIAPGSPASLKDSCAKCHPAVLLRFQVDINEMKTLYESGSCFVDTIGSQGLLTFIIR